MSSNIPKLRFAGFSGEWEDGLIGSKFDFISTNSLSRENLNYVKGSVKNIHYGDIHTIFRPLFDVTRENVPFINTNCVPNRITTNNYLQKGDVLFADASEDYNEIGKCIEVINTNNEKIVAGLHTIHARAKDSDEFHPGFVAPLLRTNSVHKQIRVIAQGIKVLSISPTSLGTVVLYRPKKEEQKKIADFLSAVDSRIEGLETMMDLQKRYKQGVMQRIFNQTIRFKDSNGNTFPDWQETKLGTIVKKSKDKNKDNSISVVFSNSATQGIVYQKDYFDNEVANSKNLDGYYIVKPFAFVYNPRISSEARVGALNVNKTNETGLVSPLYTVFNINKKNVEVTFLEFFFKSTQWHNYMLSIANYGVRDDRMNIKDDDFFEMPMLLPHPDEQKKIADFLSALDSKIEATQKQLDAAREWKKGLLQKMFV